MMNLQPVGAPEFNQPTKNKQNGGTGSQIKLTIDDVKTTF